NRFRMSDVGFRMDPSKFRHPKSDIRNPSSPLPLLMLRIHADDPHHALAVDHLALGTYLLDRRSYLHNSSSMLAAVMAWSAPTSRSTVPQTSNNRFPARTCWMASSSDSWVTRISFCAVSFTSPIATVRAESP